MNTQATYVIYHRADYDGIFCREIARRYFALEDVTYIGWNFGDAVPEIPSDARLYILDLSIQALMGHPGLIWIDHHKSAIERYPATIPGYRINGVAGCRLAWQYFFGERRPAFAPELPKLEDYVERRVAEPLAVRLAGEYDVWDKRDPDAELFQHGLDSGDIDWKTLLCDPADAEQVADAQAEVLTLLEDAVPVAYARRKANEKRILENGFDLKWQGITFLACNCGGGSLAFRAGLKPHHDAVLAFMWRGRHWSVSLYGVPGKPDVDLSSIATQFPGGGGHKQACGFQCAILPFPLSSQASGGDGR